MAPLVVRVEPIAGESLLSLVARAAHANVFPSLTHVFAHAGIVGHPAFAPFTGADHARALAELLHVQEDELSSRFHAPSRGPSPRGAVAWAGSRVRRRSIEARSRRVAPAALGASPHHRLEWTHRGLSFCPETLQQLISRCPNCSARLGWVTTKGLDRCERCEASLVDAPSRQVQTRSPARLRAAAALISPDAQVRSAALAAFPAEFHAWDAGDLFAALCELGAANRHPGEGRGSALARALSDGSYDVEAEDLARGHELLVDWPTRRFELLDRLAAHARSHRTSGALTAAHLGVLGRHLTPVATGPTLGGLLMRAVEAEAEQRRSAMRRARADEASLRDKLQNSIGLVEACKVFGISRPVLKRLVPDGRCLIAARPRRQGGVRFHREALSSTIVALQSSSPGSTVSRTLGVPRYCLPALISVGVLSRFDDPDVALLRDGAVTARSWQELQRALEGRPSFARLLTGMNSLGDHMRRRFDPMVWATAFKYVLDDPLRRISSWSPGSSRPIISQLIVSGEELAEFLPPEQPDRIDREVRLTAHEAGWLLGLAGAHLPELFEAGLLAARRVGSSWELSLGDVIDFHALYVTSSEILQRTVEPGESRSERRWIPDLNDFYGAHQTRHFKLCLREAFDLDWELSDPAFA